MAPRRIACPDCGESVPGGRLSCPSCGALLASVAGVAARAGGSANDAPSTGSTRAARGASPAAISPARIQTQTLPEPPPAGAGDQAPTLPVNRGPAIPLNPSSIRQTEVDGPSATAAAPMETPATETPPMAAASLPVPAAEVSMLADDDEADARGYDRGEVGSYVPRTRPAPYETPPGPAPVAAMAVAIPAAAAAGSSASETTDTADGLDTAQMDHALGYATAAGAGLVAFGMFMPWARVVIGSSGASGLFDTWGLAGPGHFLILVWAVAMLVISLLPNGIPVSIRSGLAGLALGIFSLGLIWPYLMFGPLGAGIGVWVVALGALVLTGTGIASAWRDRHAAADASV
jgi:hypothetical protein